MKIAGSSGSRSVPVQPLRLPAFGQQPRVVGDVIADEGADEVVAVVVAFLPAQDYRHLRRPARLLEQLWSELRLQELVGGALIDENGARPAGGRDQLAGVVRPPRFSVLAEVAAECLLAPGHLAGSDDWRQ